MIRALLVDLDDTLLRNDISRFIPAYLELLATDLVSFGPPERVLPALQRGTQAMLSNADPATTLLEAFLRGFCDTLGADRQTVEGAIHRFYAETYPRLAGLTSPMDGAADLLRTAADHGMEIAIATNPLMTYHAVEQRLGWAGVPPSAFRYSVITAVEGFHFAKPRPAYFAEILARLGRLPNEALMVGNDPGEDLRPAASIGIRGFLVTDAPDDERPGGSLVEARRWILDEQHKAAPVEPDGGALIARLEGQLAGLLGAIGDLDGAGLDRPLVAGGLSPLEVVCHLRDVDREVNLPRLEAFLGEEDPFLSAVDTDAWIVERDYNRENPAGAAAGFIEARKAVLLRLRDLDEPQWSRTARHALLGPITLVGWIAVLAQHDLRHVGQVRAAG